jgi:hypothetical protein
VLGEDGKVKFKTFKLKIMLKEDLIKQIQENIPDGMEVVLFDHRQNLNDDIGDGSSYGIYKDFEIGVHTKEEIKDGCIPFAYLSFDNDDYNDDGEKLFI